MNRQFPPEIIQLIVKASIGPVTPPDGYWKATPTRYSTLRSYSILNSTWNEISRRFLYKYVTIKKEADMEALVEACGANEGTKYLVRTLTISDRLTARSRDTRVGELVGKLLECAPRVRTLVVRHNDVRFGDLVQLQNLRRLYLTTVIFERPPFQHPFSATASLPSLTHLDCFNCNFGPISDSFFHPRFLPRLRSIAYREEENEPADFQHLGPQLEAVLVRSDAACAAILPHTSDSLVLLSLSPNVQLSTALSHLPTTPRFLHLDLTDADATRESLEFQIDNRKGGLEMVFLNTEDASRGWEWYVEPCIDALELLVVRFEVGELSFLKVIEKVDKIVEEMR